MDTLEQSQTLDRQPWMQPDDAWFSVPGSNRQLAFNEEGYFAQSLTGIAVPIYIFSAVTGRLEIEERNNSSLRNYRTVYGHSEFGQDLRAALTRADFPFSASDPQAVDEWHGRYAVLCDSEASLVAMSWPDVNDRLHEAQEAHTAQRRLVRAAETAKAHERRTERKRKEERAATLRATPEYDAMFERVFGKPQAALDSTDPATAVRYARWLVDYRLGLQEKLGAALK